CDDPEYERRQSRHAGAAGRTPGGDACRALVGDPHQPVRRRPSADGLARAPTGADLKGGTVAVSTAGSESDITVNLALVRLGLNRADIAFKDYGGGPGGAAGGGG